MTNLLKMKLWVLPLLLIFGSGACFAQATNAGDIRGSVTDSSGALISGVTVTVVNVDTGVSKSYTTNDAGLYDTNSIVTGSYTVTFSKGGFEKLVRGPVTLQVGFTTVNGELKVGAETQEVTVTTDVPLLKTETSEQSTTLEAKSMEQLPQVAGGAGVSWENFMILLPGATGTPNGNQGSSNPGQEVAINGNLPYSNILADGASTTLSHSQNANPAIFETVSELQVSTSSFSAQYGIGGAIFNQISKGGSSQFHGAAYDYLQNDALTAFPYEFGASPASIGKIPFLRYNNFGFAVGGPILKKKMFFYFDYDQIVDHGNNTSNPPNSVPTAAVMAGDFTGMQNIFDPTTQVIMHDANNNPYPVRQSFASEYPSLGNAVPSALFDTLALKMQQFYPTPTSHIPGGAFVTPQSINSEGIPQHNFYSSQQQSTPYRKFFGRLDYDVKSSNRITMSDTQSDTPVVYANQVTACPIGCQTGDVDNNNAQITDVWNISPRTVNEARMGFTSQLNFFADLALNKGYASQLGWQFAKADDFPAINFTGSYPYAWIDPSSNSVYKEFTWDPSDVVTMIRGKHILHFGGELLAYQNNSTAWGNVNAGTYTFSGQYTQQWALDNNGVAAPVAGTGLEYADFLLGYTQGWSAAVSPEYGARLKSPQIFVQDDWKVRPNLTLNLGLRYQINHGWTEVKNNMSSFDPTVINPATNTPGAYWFGTTHANGRTALQANTFNTWQPRLGFAWAYNPKTTLRGGFGVYSYTWSLDTYGGDNRTYGMGAEVGAAGSTSDQTNGIIPVTTLGGTGTVCTAPLPTGGCSGTTPLPYVAASADPTRFNGQGAGYIQYHTPVPRILQWNVSVQRALSTDLVAEVAYVASHGSNLSFSTDLNQVPQNLLSSNDSGNRPYVNYQGIPGSTNNAISNYNSLQTSITKRMTNGLSLSFNYVWSHMLDDWDSSGFGSHSGPQDFQIASTYNPRANYSNSNFDVRHAFKGYAVYQLPFGRGKPFLNSSRLLDEAVGGWQISGTVVLQTGNPFTVYGNQNTYAQAGTSYPNRNPGVPLYPSNRGILNWFNPAAFTEPANGTFGNVRRNSLYGPGINTFNMSAAKAFTIPWREGISIQFRADAQNVFNHPSFGTPNNTGLGGAAGVGQPYTGTSPITSLTVYGRNLQLGLRVSF
jgi:Carboxypeptidase regulatory-like domain/TonB dependent receptor